MSLKCCVNDDDLIGVETSSLNYIIKFDVFAVHWFIIVLIYFYSPFGPSWPLLG
jgi:hypothetical protein